MEFIQIPTEQTTAATDVVLAIFALLSAILIYKKGKSISPFRARIWANAFFALSIAAILGAVAHGVQLSAGMHSGTWHLINFALAMTMAMFLVAVVHDMAGVTKARNWLPLLLAISLVFFLVTIWRPGAFLTFIIFESLGMSIAIIAYAVAAAKKIVPGAAAIVIGILLTMVAAGIQASGAFGFEFIWEFDHNGVFHLVQMLALPFFVSGINAGFAR